MCKVSIRTATEQDIPAILAIYGPYVENTAISFEYEIPTETAFLERFRRITRQFPWLVWEENEKILGYAYAAAPFERAAYQWCAEPSVYLAPEARRKGVGKALYDALEEALCRQGYYALYAIITSENRDSLAFHKAMGYHAIAEFPDCGFKHGKWYGITWMEKRLKDTTNPEEKPVPFLKNAKFFQK